MSHSLTRRAKTGCMQLFRERFKKKSLRGTRLSTKRRTKSHNPLENFRLFWSLVLDDTHNQAVTIGWDNDLVGSFAVNNLHLCLVAH